MRQVALLAGLILLFAAGPARAGKPSYTLSEALRIARAQNPDIAIAQKKEEAARAGIVEARAGYLPAIVSGGIYRQRERAADSRLRPEDYDFTLRAVQKVYAGGATKSSTAIARLQREKAQADLQAVINRVTMEVRLAYAELLLNRERIGVRAAAVGVMEQELKTQTERFNAGTVGQLNVRRAEVTLANQQPELIQAQTDLRNSYLKLGELLGVEASAPEGEAPFEATGQLVYEVRYPNLDGCLGRATINRPEIESARRDIEIEEQQLILDRSATRPRVDFFTGYEVYNQRDPDLGREFNHGYIVGVDASWAIFDGFATRGRMDATRARRDAARHALDALRLSIEREVRSAFLDLQQADRVLDSQKKNIQTADESLEIARGNLAAGLGTQLDILQAANDVTATRSTNLDAIYLHNAALARLDRACGGETGSADPQVFEVAHPPSSLGKK